MRRPGERPGCRSSCSATERRSTRFSTDRSSCRLVWAWGKTRSRKHPAWSEWPPPSAPTWDTDSRETWASVDIGLFAQYMYVINGTEFEEHDVAVGLQFAPLMLGGVGWLHERRAPVVELR